MKKIIKEYPVLLEEKLNIEAYENILEKFPQWSSIKREIKINSLLKDKKIQFVVDKIKGLIIGQVGKSKSDNVTLKDAAFVIKSMSFIIKNLVVIEMSVKVEVLMTTYGNILKELINHESDFTINQSINKGKVSYFYISPISTSSNFAA